MIRSALKALFIGFISTLLFGESALNAQTENLIYAVTGTAEIKIEPDEVIITMSVETSDKSPEQAARRITEQILNIKNMAREFGISGEDTRIDFEYFRPKFEDKKLDKYQIKKRISIVLRELTRIDDLLVALYSEGINNIPNISFRVSDMRNYRNKARIMAVRAAVQKAGDIAEELGLKIGNVKNVETDETQRLSSSVSTYPSPVNVSTEIYEAGLMGDITRTPGKISIIASATIEFELNNVDSKQGGNTDN